MLSFSCSVMSNSLQPYGLQHTSLPYLLEFAETRVHWVSDTIQLSQPVSPFSSCLQSFQHQGLFQWVSSLHQGPKCWSFSISPSNEHSGLISFRIDWFALLAVQRDSQESSPAPQFKHINSSALSLLHDPALTSVHDYWKNHSFD